MSTWHDFLPAAEAIVKAEKELWPHCEGVQCGGGGGSGSFSRKGTGLHERYYSVPSEIQSLIMENVREAGTDPGLQAQQGSLFSRLMTDTAQAQPGYSQLSDFAGMSPTGYGGWSTLYNVAARDPYDGAFAADTEAAYRQRASDAMAQAATGPEAVRGGSARSGIAQGVLSDRLAQGRGQEIRAAQLQDLSAVMDAAKSMGTIEQMRTNSAIQSAQGLSNISTGVAQRGLEAGKALDINKVQNLGLLQLAAQLQGKTLDKQTDDFYGKGDQSSWQAGLSCCFIFLEALNGELPWYIELARVDFWTQPRRNGYTWMSRALVPVMRWSKLAKYLVNTVLVKPFLRYGAWLYGEETASSRSALLAPYCHAWLRLWGALGRIVR